MSYRRLGGLGVPTDPAQRAAATAARDTGGMRLLNTLGCERAALQTVRDRGRTEKHRRALRADHPTGSEACGNASCWHTSARLAPAAKQKRHGPGGLWQGGAHDATAVSTGNE